VGGLLQKFGGSRWILNRRRGLGWQKFQALTGRIVSYFLSSKNSFFEENYQRDVGTNQWIKFSAM
jgi:hypothetical protein